MAGVRGGDARLTAPHAFGLFIFITGALFDVLTRAQQLHTRRPPAEPLQVSPDKGREVLTNIFENIAIRAMGVCLSTDESERAKEIKIKTSIPTRPKKDLNQADFKSSGLVGKKVEKTPGMINGIQFLIEECKDSTIFLIDKIGPITMEACQGCTVVCGPSDSSVFIRDCKDCRIIITCQQLRLRDCNNMDILVHSQTGPIIESSTEIRIGCYSWDYFEIARHFEAHDFSVFQNMWYKVYDFTPTYLGEGVNYTLLPLTIEHKAILGDAATGSSYEAIQADGNAPSDDRTPFVLRPHGPTKGSFASLFNKSRFFCLPAAHEEVLRDILANGGPCLLRCTKMMLNRSRANMLFEKASMPAPLPKASTKSCFGKAPPESPLPFIIIVVLSDMQDEEKSLEARLLERDVPSGHICAVDGAQNLEELSRIVFDLWLDVGN